MKNVRSSQPCISINFFSKSQVLPCEYRRVKSEALAVFVVIIAAAKKRMFEIQSVHININ